MINADDLAKVIIVVNILIQKLLSVVVLRHSVEHIDAKSPDGNVAFSEVLSKYLPKFKEVRLLTTISNKSKILEINGQVKTSIDVARLDSWFLLNVLLKVNTFFDFSSINGNCFKQCEKCCSDCEHASPTCNKCKSNCNKPTTKCDHICKHCKISKKVCNDYSEICCSSCQMCKNCNKDALEKKIQSILNNSNSLVMVVQPCILTEYKESFEILLLFRNLSAHGSKKDCEYFLDGKCHIGDLENIKSYDQLKHYIKYAFTVILGYITNPAKFKQPENEHLKEQVLKDLSCTFECGKTLEENLRDIDKFKEIFQESAGIIHSLENLTSECQSGFQECRSGFQKITELLTNPSKEDNKKSGQIKQSKELPLEKNCGSYCIFRLDHQLSKDDVQSFKLAEGEKEDDKDWKTVDYEIINVKDFSYIVIKEGCLKDEFTYSLKLELKDGDILECDKLIGKRKGYFDNENVTTSKIILISYNDGTPSNAHGDEFEKEMKELEWKINQKIKRIDGGASVPATNIKEFKDLCKEYYKRNKYIKRFISDDVVNTGDVVSDMFLKLFQSSGEDEEFKIICGPDFTRQLTLFEINGSFRNSMESIEKDPQMHHSGHEFLITNLSKRLIMVICVCDSEDVHDVNHALKRCNANLKVFRILHEKSLTDAFAGVCGIVACPLIRKIGLEEQNFLYDDKDRSLILTKDDLVDEDALEIWLEETILETIDSKLTDFDIGNTESTLWENAYEAVVGETMAIMSITDCTLPTISKNNYRQVKSLLLNSEQRSAIKKGSCIVNGPFGSGKSIVLKEIAKRLCRDAKKELSIYFVCLEPYSLLEVDSVKFLEELKSETPSGINFYNMRDMFRQAAEAGIHIHDIPSIIEHICNTEEKPTIFLFDEVDGERFTKEYASRLKYVIANNKYLQQIVLAPQSIQKDREIHRNDQKTPLEKNQFKEIELEVVELTQRMRMTEKINVLLQVAEDCVEKIETVYVIPESPKKKDPNNLKNGQQDNNQMPMPITNTSEEDVKDQGNQTQKEEGGLNQEQQNAENSSQFEDDIATITKETDAMDIAEREERSQDNQEEESKVSPNDPSDEGRVMNDGEDEDDSTGTGQYPNKKKEKHKKRLNVQDHLDTDDILEESQLLNESSSSNLIRSKYRCQQGDIGHNIQGQKPRLIFLNSDFDMKSSKSGKILSRILKTTCFENERKRKTIICSNLSEATLACYSLECLRKKICPYFHHLLQTSLIPTFKEKEDAWNKIDDGKKDRVLVTDHRSFRGCETEHCITFVNQDSAYKSHVLVEILARAVAHVDILVLPTQAAKRERSNEATLADIINEWMKPIDDQSIVEVVKVSVKEKPRKPGILVVNIDGKSFECKLSENDDKDHETVIKYFERGDKVSEKHRTQHLENAKIISPISPESIEGEEDSSFSFTKTTWENLEFLHPSTFGLVIGKGGKNLIKLKNRFNVSLRHDKLRSKMQICGSIDNKTKAAEHLRSVYRGWDVIFDSNWKNYSKIVNIVSNRYWIYQKKFNISINTDKHHNQISIKGERKNKIRFVVSIYKKLLKPTRFGSRSLVCLGLKENYSIALVTSQNDEKLCEFHSNVNEYSENHSMSQVNELLLKALNEAKAKQSSLSKSMCCIMLHGGKMFSKLPAGKYPMKRLFVELRKQMMYKKLVHGDLNVDAMTGSDHIRTIYRYDLTILTPEPTISVRCKLYLKKNEPNAMFLNCREAGDRKPSFSNIPAWPVYIDIPGQKITRLDIVDPRNGLTTRVNVSVFEVDEEYEKDLKMHLNILKEKVFDLIDIKRGTIDLDIPEMPDGYILCYLRRSERVAHRIARKTILTTSSEKVLLNYEDLDESEEIDLFIDDEDILDDLDKTDWSPTDVATKYDRVIQLGKDLISRAYSWQGS